MGNNNQSENGELSNSPLLDSSDASSTEFPARHVPSKPEKIVTPVESIDSLKRRLAKALKGMSPFSAPDPAEARRQAELRKLPPRQRETMQRLLAGDGEKQIAGRLKISGHTVHVYVKQLYATYHVSSRGELLSVWMDAKFSDKNGEPSESST